MKREGISTLSIRSYLQALNCLGHFNCFLCVCLKRFFEKAFRLDFVMILAGMYTKCLEMFCFGKGLCNDSRWNVYKALENILKL